MGWARGTKGARELSRANDSNGSKSRTPWALPNTSARAASASSSIWRPKLQPQPTMPLWPSRPLNCAKGGGVSPELARVSQMARRIRGNAPASATRTLRNSNEPRGSWRCRPHRGARRQSTVGEGRRSAAAGVTDHARDDRLNAVRGENGLLNPAASSRRKGRVPARGHSRRSQIAIPPNQTQTP